MPPFTSFHKLECLFCHIYYIMLFNFCNFSCFWNMNLILKASFNLFISFWGERCSSVVVGYLARRCEMRVCVPFRWDRPENNIYHFPAECPDHQKLSFGVYLPPLLWTCTAKNVKVMGSEWSNREPDSRGCWVRAFLRDRGWPGFWSLIQGYFCLTSGSLI